MDGTVGEKQAGYSIGGGNKADNFRETGVGRPGQRFGEEKNGVAGGRTRGRVFQACGGVEMEMGTPRKNGVCYLVDRRNPAEERILLSLCSITRLADAIIRANTATNPLFPKQRPPAFDGETMSLAVSHRRACSLSIDKPLDSMKFLHANRKSSLELRSP